MQSEYDYISEIINLFGFNGAKCHVVELCADFDVRIERNKTENRLYHKESKRDIEWSEAEIFRLKEKNSWIIIYNSNNIQLTGLIKF